MILIAIFLSLCGFRLQAEVNARAQILGLR
jgi:hypothetical protein